MSFFRTFIGAFYSPAVYQQVRQSAGYGLKYTFQLVLLLFVLIVVVAAPTLIGLHQELFVGKNGKISVVDDLLMQTARQMPVMTYENQTLTTAEAGAHTIHLTTNILGNALEGDVATIDTSGATTHANMKTPFLITANEVIAKEEKETKIKSFKDIEKENSARSTIQFTPEIAKEMAISISEWLQGVLPIFYAVLGTIAAVAVIVSNYIGRLVMLACVALAGLLIAKLIGQKVTWEESFRMAALSFTPIAILAILFSPVGFYTLLLTGSVMLWVALRVSKPVEPETV